MCFSVEADVAVGLVILPVAVASRRGAARPRGAVRGPTVAVRAPPARRGARVGRCGRSGVPRGAACGRGGVPPVRPAGAARADAGRCPAPRTEGSPQARGAVRGPRRGGLDVPRLGSARRALHRDRAPARDRVRHRHPPGQLVGGALHRGRDRAPRCPATAPSSPSAGSTWSGSRSWWSPTTRRSSRCGACSPRACPCSSSCTWCVADGYRRQSGFMGYSWTHE